MNKHRYKQWIGIDDTAQDAITYLVEYAKVIQRFNGDCSRLVQSIDIVLDELHKKNEEYKRLNDENKTLLKVGIDE